MTNSTPILELTSITKVYEQGRLQVKAVDGIDLTITKGEFTALCGPSGSGKTTTLNIIGALDTPTEGTVRLEGRDLSGLTRAQLAIMRRDRVGFVFQAYNLIATLTAFENAELVLSLQSVPIKERRDIIYSLLKEVGLEGMEDRRPDELSGGQQQRVAIARAIAHEPAVVLADEPTANVDSHTADALLGLMEKLNHDKGVTFLFSTHDQRVMDRAHRIITMHDGKIEKDEAKTPVA